MKKFKKVLAAVLAMAMVLGMSVTSMAAETEKPDTKKATGTSSDKGNITVSGIDWSEQGKITVKAYKIIEAEYDTKDVFIGYKPVDGIENNITPEKGVNLELSNTDFSTISNIAAQLKGTEAVQEVKEPSGTDKNAVFTNLDVGTYLILVEGAELQIYNPIVASIYYSPVGANAGITENELTNGNINITQTHAWVKISEKPTVRKEIEKATSSDATPSTVKGSTANIGDVVDFKVTVNPIPNYGGKEPVFNIKDTLSQGLDYVNGSLEVLVDGKTLDSNNYTATASDASKDISVDFVKIEAGKKVYKLNGNVGGELVIKYSARLNEQAVINDAENAQGNANNVVLNYTKDSTITGNDATSSDVTHTYTFDIDGTRTGNVLTKKDGIATDSKPLQGAKFTLYKENPASNSNATVYTQKINDTVVFNGTVTSDVNGQLQIRGLEAGTYYLKETEAPKGYSLNTHVFTIVIDASTDENGKLTSWSIAIDGDITNTFTATGNERPTEFVIPNTKLSSLPSTGGIGTTIFTLGGCAIMIIAAGLYFASRRKKNEE